MAKLAQITRNPPLHMQPHVSRRRRRRAVPSISHDQDTLFIKGKIVDTISVISENLSQRLYSFPKERCLDPESIRRDCQCLQLWTDTGGGVSARRATVDLEWSLDMLTQEMSFVPFSTEICHLFFVKMVTAFIDWSARRMSTGIWMAKPLICTRLKPESSRYGEI